MSLISKDCVTVVHPPAKLDMYLVLCQLAQLDKVLIY